MAFIKEKGVLTYKSEVETGMSKAGNAWAKMNIVVSREEINAPYDKVALSVFGDKVNDCSNVKVGDKVEVTYTISAREYNGKWYNDVSLYKIEGLDARRSAPAAPAPAAPQEEIKGDLPF